MIHLPKNETKLMVAVHGWSGILLGLVLYAVVLTGTAAVFAEEIGTWSSGHISTTSACWRQSWRSGCAKLVSLAARTACGACPAGSGCGRASGHGDSSGCESL